tara:strand:+ start:314 stop:496 length:183 start_codon:yes stop_codon:yes gene_type:complete
MKIVIPNKIFLQNKLLNNGAIVGVTVVTTSAAIAAARGFSGNIKAADVILLIRINGWIIL